MKSICSFKKHLRKWRYYKVKKRMKTCTVCKHNLDDTIFKWNSKNHMSCKPCVDRACKWQSDHWPKVCVKMSKVSDQKSNRPWAEAEYVTPNFLLEQLEKQWRVCFWCGVSMQTKNRKAPDGLTIERLYNHLPHIKVNSVLACHCCNVRQRVIFKEPFLLC